MKVRVSMCVSVCVSMRMCMCVCVGWDGEACAVCVCAWDGVSYIRTCSMGVPLFLQYSRSICVIICACVSMYAL